MTFEEYQQAALKTARPKEANDEFFHLVLGLVGETGEIAEKIKKVVRDQNSNLDLIDRNDIEKELGDILWYLTVLGDYLGLSLESIAIKNKNKLADRQTRGVLEGSGDNR